ncbi:MAG: LysR family transcriptional regulator [Candidatus Sericytochromatia bacterium]
MKIDILNGLIALKIVAEKGNFTSAAKEMGVSTSAISQTIKQLEKKLGCTLLNRTTRSISLTEIGKNFLQQYKPSLENLINSIEQLGSFTGKPIGTLRLNLPHSSWITVLKPIISGFQKKYPEIILELFFEDSLIDMVKEGFDAGIRPSEMTAGDMTAIKISPPFKYVVAASPDYFKKYGEPKHPKDLLNHNCIQYRFGNGNIYKKWEFEKNGKDINVETKGNLVVNDSFVMIESGLNGLGLFYTTKDHIEKYLKTKELVVVLEDYSPHSEGYYLYYPSISQVSPKLRAFIDYIKETKI